MRVTCIKEAGHTEIQPLLCCVAEAVAVMSGLAVSRVLLLTDTTGQACYTCSTACHKSCVTTKCHVLWAKLNNKNDVLQM